MALDIDALETSFDLIAPRGDELTEIFYPVVGAVLIASMAEVAGDAWCTEFTSAWAKAYEVVADRMRFGAAGVRRRRAA